MTRGEGKKESNTKKIFRSRINQVEGFRGYFKGLGPNLIGVIPARSINFFTYGNGKRIYTELNGGKETAGVHLISAATAGNYRKWIN